MDGHQLDRAFKYFNMADPEGSGKIGFNDWRDLLQKARKKKHINPIVRGMAGMMAPESALHMEFDNADVNKDGFLDFPEFLAVSAPLIYSFILLTFFSIFQTWRDFEVALIDSSWNPLKNDARRMKMMTQDYTNMKAQGQHMTVQFHSRHF